MAEQANEYTGKNVDDAIDDGLRQIGLSRSEVEIEVISKGSRGIFGLGSEPARVRIIPIPRPESDSPKGDGAGVGTQQKPKPQSTRPVRTQPAASSTIDASPTEQSAVDVPDMPETVVGDETTDVVDSEPRIADSNDLQTDSDDDDELRDLAVELLDGLLNRMGFAHASIALSWQIDEDDAARYLLLDVQGDDLGPLIGRRGETLASIQYLVRLMINQRLRQWKNVVVDVEQYKQRRVIQLNQLANRMAEQVVDSGRAVSLEPMPANERRIVHLALRDHPSVYTQSSGEGERRKVHIVARE